MKVDFTFLPTEMCLIHLGDSEWGNQEMERVAMEFFADNPTCEFVQIYEHAGWSLSWRRDGSICGTANDMAVLKPGPRPESLAYSIRRMPNDYGKVCEYPLGRARPRLEMVA